MQFLFGRVLIRIRIRAIDALSVIAVHDEDDAVRAAVIMPPQRANTLLTAHVPYREVDVFVLDTLDIEANRRHRVKNLAQLELIQNGGFARGIEPKNINFTVWDVGG